MLLMVLFCIEFGCANIIVYRDSPEPLIRSKVYVMHSYNFCMYSLHAELHCSYNDIVSVYGQQEKAIIMINVLVGVRCNS